MVSLRCLGALARLRSFSRSGLGANWGFTPNPAACSTCAGTFSHLIQFLDHAVEERFLRQENRDLLLWATEPDKLLDLFEGYRPSHIPKWIDREQT